MTDIIERLRELEEWSSTGILCEGAIRRLAATIPIDSVPAQLRAAADQTYREAAAIVLALEEEEPSGYLVSAEGLLAVVHDKASAEEAKAQGHQVDKIYLFPM